VLYDDAQHVHITRQHSIAHVTCIKALQNITEQPKTFKHVFHKALHNYFRQPTSVAVDEKSFGGPFVPVVPLPASEHMLPQSTTQY
jgi:hypothetical protein